MAVGKERARCKVSVVAQAVAECKEAVPYDALQPYDDHFYPLRGINQTHSTVKKTRTVGNPYTTLHAVPHHEQVIQKGKMDQWDYVLRRMFVKKASSLKDCIPFVFRFFCALTENLITYFQIDCTWCENTPEDGDRA
jgi:mitochondrial transcription factor 1